MVNKNKVRCAWVNDDPLYINYHDNEWGVPIYDDRLLFVYYSNGKRKIFQGSGVFWTNIETKKRCDNICLIDTLCNIKIQIDKIKIQIDKTGKNYVDLTQEII